MSREVVMFMSEELVDMEVLDDNEEVGIVTWMCQSLGKCCVVGTAPGHRITATWPARRMKNDHCLRTVTTGAILRRSQGCVGVD